MSIHLSSKEKSKLLGFCGYGNLDAPVWFIGLEERGHGEDNLIRRLKFEGVEDLALSHSIFSISGLMRP